MTPNRLPLLLMAGALVMATCNSAAAELKKKVGRTMNQYIQLYQFTRAGNPIALARITLVQVHPGPGEEDETVEVDIEITEALWQERGANRRTYKFRRPASSLMQLRIPDPVWGRAKLEQGARILIVFANSTASSTTNPVYVDPIADGGDPVLQSVRSVLDTERSVRDHSGLFKKRLTQLSGGTVEKLFAGEALANDGPFPAEEETRIGEALARAFAQEKDDYVKISLGSWVWDSVYPRTGVAGRVNILKATLHAAGSASEHVRTFALDRLAQVQPTILREAGVKASPDVVRLLEDRRGKEDDAEVRRHLEEIIAVLRR